MEVNIVYRTKHHVLREVNTVQSVSLVHIPSVSVLCVCGGHTDRTAAEAVAARRRACEARESSSVNIIVEEDYSKAGKFISTVCS